MSIPSAVDRSRWWGVIGYEVSMLRWLRSISVPVSLLGNSISEGSVLHTRNLCDFCTFSAANDIKPSDLFENYPEDPEYKHSVGL